MATAKKKTAEKPALTQAEARRQLDGFLANYTPEIAAQGKAALRAMRKLYPTAVELVYDNYNALAVGFSPAERVSEVIFSIAVYPRWVNLFFLQARGLPDPNKLLQGSGSVARHVRLDSPKRIHTPEIQMLMSDAVLCARTPFTADGKHRIQIKSIAAKQRPRRPSGKAK